MEKTGVVVVGGGPAPVISALTAKSNYPDKEVMVIRNYDNTPIPCGIPYVFGTLEGVRKILCLICLLKKLKSSC